MLDALAAKVLAYADSCGMGEEPQQTAVARLGVSRHRSVTAFAPVLYEPLFCLVLDGGKQALQGDEIVDFPKGHSVIVGVDLPTQTRINQASADHPYVALALKLDMGLIRELAAREPVAGNSAHGAPAISAAEADDAIINAMGRLFSLLEKPQATQVLHPLLMTEIHYWLLFAQHGALLRQLASADSHAARIAQAIAVIRSKFEQVLVVADLASSVGMSVSAFHLHFKAITGTTPLQFQKRLRLIEAKRLMLAERQSVSSAAYSVGYESPTQFSREYARMFGRPPVKDIGMPGPVLLSA